MGYGIDDLHFETAYWYSDVDLFALETRFGKRFMDKLYFHMLAFEASKMVSLKPNSIDLGPFASLHTEVFEALWQTIVHNVWAQWRYRHHLPDYDGPSFTSVPVSNPSQPLVIETGNPEVLSFCGGGKDSLVAMQLLERAGIDYGAFAYSNSVYGTADLQHELIKQLLTHGQPKQQHTLRVYDSFVDAPLLQLYPEYEVTEILAAETPCSLFAVLPVILEHRYRYIVLAHERSANAGNLIWSETGEDVNHQWGKSYAAERLLNQYLQSEFIANCAYFSVLQPVYDTLIFNLLRRDQQVVADTHSCNIRKPWCLKCPKCAYVWLNYMAYLDCGYIDTLFGANLFDIQENQQWYYQMLGLREHTPFECIGQIDEVRLAFELCKHKGLKGEAMEIYHRHFPALEPTPIIEHYLDVDMSQSAIPAEFAGKVQALFEVGARQSKEYIENTLS